MRAAFTRQLPLQSFQERRRNAVIIRELLGTIMHFYTRQLAQKLVMGALVSILKSSPTADIKDEDCGELCTADSYVFNELPKTGAVRDLQSAPRLIRVRFYKLKVAGPGIVSNSRRLVVERILLMFSGHPQILCCVHAWSPSYGAAARNHPALLNYNTKISKS